MKIGEYPLVDTSDIDSFVASYAQINQHINPLALLDESDNGFTVEEIMLHTIREKSLVLAGIAVYASAQFVIGLDDVDQLSPTKAVADESTKFAGKFVDVIVCDFTEAVRKAGMLADRDETVQLPGLVFETADEQDDFAEILGLVSLAPFCAVLPSSNYELRRIPFAA